MEFSKFIYELTKAYKLRSDCGKSGMPQVDIIKNSELLDFFCDKNTSNSNIIEVYWEPNTDKIWIIIK